MIRVNLLYADDVYISPQSRMAGLLPLFRSFTERDADGMWADSGDTRTRVPLITLLEAGYVVRCPGRTPAERYRANPYAIPEILRKKLLRSRKRRRSLRDDQLRFMEEAKRVMPFPYLRHFTEDSLHRMLGRTHDDPWARDAMDELLRDGYVIRIPAKGIKAYYRVNPYIIPRMLFGRLLSPLSKHRFRKRWGK